MPLIAVIVTTDYLKTIGSKGERIAEANFWKLWKDKSNPEWLGVKRELRLLYLLRRFLHLSAGALAV
jgi:hypothetical protein